TISVFDITDPQQVNELLVTPVADDTGNFSFSLPAGAARTLLAIAGSTPGETLEGPVSERTNWKGTGHKADLLVITHSKFREAAEQLAAYGRARGRCEEG